MPQVFEASWIHPSSPLAAAVWSCLSSEKISDPKKYTETRQKHFLQNVKDVGIIMPKSIQARCRHGSM